MGRRSGTEPSADQHFFQRMLHALDMTPRDLARELAGGDRQLQREISATLRVWATTPANRLSDVDRDELWFSIEAHVDKQLAYLLALKHELNVLLQKQRQERAAQRMRLQAVPPAPSPPALPRRPLSGQR